MVNNIYVVKAYNFARENPGRACGALAIAWPLFVLLAALLVLLSPVVFSVGMVTAVLLNKFGAPAMAEPVPTRKAIGSNAYYDKYPQVEPKTKLGALYSRPERIRKTPWRIAYPS